MPREELSVELLKDRDVIILDLDMTSQVEVLKNAKSVLMIDHHSSGSKNYTQLIENKVPGFQVVYDSKKSAAKLSWEFFNGDLPCRMVDYIQDRDIWTWSLPNSKEINEALYTMNSFENFWDMEQFYLDWQSDPENFERKLLGIGEGAKIYQNKLVDDFSRKIVPATIRVGTEDNYVLVPVLLCNSSTLRSEIGNCIMEEYAKYYEEVGFYAKMACIWGYNTVKDIITVSCRTNLDIDLNDYLKTIIGSNGKGGGHPKAGAFALDGCDIRKVFTIVTDLKSKETKQIKE
jgi:single-stranded DNA-specific DHH superfamily exonuclease